MKSLKEFRRTCLTRHLPVRENNAALIGNLAGEFDIRGDSLTTGVDWVAASMLTSPLFARHGREVCVNLALPNLNSDPPEFVEFA